MSATSEFPRQISYSVEDAAKATGLSEYRIRTLIREGTLAARYDGARVLVDARSLELFYNSLPSERQVHRDCAANERSIA